MRTREPDRNPWSLLILVVLLVASVMLWWRANRAPAPELERPRESAAGQPRESDRGPDRIEPEAVVGSAATAAEPITDSDGEAPQLMGVRFDPPEPVTGSHLIAIAEIEPQPEADPDLQFRWYLNGALVQDSPENELKTQCKRDDEIVVEVSLGTEPGTVQAVRERVTVANAGPQIEQIEHRLNGSEYRAVFQAADPEGDEILFQCTSCPEGMDFDHNSLQWKVSHDEGTYPVAVALRDQHGDGSIASFAITVSNRKGLHIVVQ